MSPEEYKRMEFGNIWHRIEEAVINNRNFFWIPDWYFNNYYWEREKDGIGRMIGKGYNLEEELTQLGLSIEYLLEEEIERLMSDSKDVDVKIVVDWSKVNINDLKKALKTIR